MDEAVGPATRKIRPGARGKNKVKSGCLTCKLRRKKCDESRPFCGQCMATGRLCDFQSLALANPRTPASLKSQTPVTLTNFGTRLLEYFRAICIKEVALLYCSSAWEDILLRGISFEPFACHIALAISALTQVHYLNGHASPAHLRGNVSLHDYANRQYTLAIQSLNMRLNETAGSAELAVVGSILFINMEFLRAKETQRGQNSSLMAVHIYSGLGILNRLKESAECPKLVCSWGLLENALLDILGQLEQLQKSQAGSDKT